MGLRYWINKVKIYLNPPKKYDTFYGDAMNFVLTSRVEKVLHGLYDTSGDDLVDLVLGADSFRLTIEEDNVTYYLVKTEVLVKDYSDTFHWKQRCQPRRIPKKSFLMMVADELLFRI